MNLCINHPQLSLFLQFPVSTKSQSEKIKKIKEFQAILVKTDTGATEGQS